MAKSTASADPAQGLDLVPVSDTFRGVTVFSERERGGQGPGSDRYFLTRLVDGRCQRLPVASRRGVPFDVDLGPRASWAPWEGARGPCWSTL